MSESVIRVLIGVSYYVNISNDSIGRKLQDYQMDKFGWERSNDSGIHMTIGTYRTMGTLCVDWLITWLLEISNSWLLQKREQVD